MLFGCGISGPKCKILQGIKLINPLVLGFWSHCQSQLEWEKYLSASLWCGGLLRIVGQKWSAQRISRYIQDCSTWNNGFLFGLLFAIMFHVEHLHHELALRFHKPVF